MTVFIYLTASYIWLRGSLKDGSKVGTNTATYGSWQGTKGRYMESESGHFGLDLCGLV